MLLDENYRHHFFSTRVVKMWNSLSEVTVQARTINELKSRLRRDWTGHPGPGPGAGPDICYNIYGYIIVGTGKSARGASVGRLKFVSTRFFCP